MNVNVDFGADFGVDFDFNADVGVDVDVGYDINFSVSFHLAVDVGVGVDACPVVVYIYKNLQTTMSFALSITSFSLYRPSHPSYSPRF